MCVCVCAVCVCACVCVARRSEKGARGEARRDARSFPHNNNDGDEKRKKHYCTAGTGAVVLVMVLVRRHCIHIYLRRYEVVLW